MAAWNCRCVAIIAFIASQYVLILGTGGVFITVLILAKTVNAREDIITYLEKIFKYV